MTTFSLEAVRARHGDALLLFTADKVIMIDGGAARVYDQSLRSRLEQLASRTGGTLPIPLLVLSHIDDDHVNGLLDLTEELIESDQSRERPLVKIDQLWHNSFSDTIADLSGARAVKESSLSVADTATGDSEIREKLTRQTGLVLQSVGQGRRLRNDASRLKMRLNNGFADGLILRETAGDRVHRFGAATLRVVGPGQKEVDKLRARWKKDVEKILEKEREKELALQAAASLDTSVFNLASIVLLASSPAGPEPDARNRTMLLTGDARGDMILEWLEASELLDDDGKLHVDLLKLPHHGSDRNVRSQRTLKPGEIARSDFLERVTADHYVVSGDGRHGNPEPETFRMLFEARGVDDEYEIHMTYGPEELAQSHEFDAEALDEVLDAHPGRRERLNFPSPGVSSVGVSL